MNKGVVIYKDIFDMPEEEFNKMQSKCKRAVEHSEDYLKGFEDCKCQMLAGMNTIELQLAKLYTLVKELKNVSLE